MLNAPPARDVLCGGSSQWPSEGVCEDRDYDFDGWASIVDQRLAEDEALVRRYADGEGRGQDMGPVRNFVRKVRADLGPRAVLASVKMNVTGSGHEVIVGYYFPGDEDASAAAAEAGESVIDAIPTRLDASIPAPSAPIPADNGRMPSTQRGAALPAVSRQSAVSRQPDLPAQACARGQRTPLGGAAQPARATPMRKAMPLGDLSPRGEVAPRGQVTPRGEVSPPGEVSPRGEVARPAQETRPA